MRSRCSARFHTLLLLALAAISIACGVPFWRVVLGASRGDPTPANAVIAESQAVARRVTAQGLRAQDLARVIAANELRLLAFNVASMLGEARRKPVDALSNEKAHLVQRLRELTQQVEIGVEPVSGRGSPFALDAGALGGLFDRRDRRVLVDRVEGVTQVERTERGYRLALWGSTLGEPASPRSATSLTLLLEGRPVEVRARPDGAHRAELWIPNRVLAPFFEENAVGSVNATLLVERRVRRGWWIFPFETVRDHELSLVIALLPRYAGTLEIEYEYADPSDPTALTSFCPIDADSPAAAPDADAAPADDAVAWDFAASSCPMPESGVLRDGKSFEITHGRRARVRVPRYLLSWRVIGRTLYNLPVEVASGAPRSGAILEYLEAEEEGDEQVLIFDVNPPAGLSQVGARR